MRRFSVLLLIVTLVVALSPLSASNMQMIHPITSEVHTAITTLSIASGLALPSSAGPWSSDELAKMLNKIDRAALSPSLQEVYDYAYQSVQPVDRTFKFGLSVALEGYYHTDSVNFVNEPDWIRGFNEREPMLKVVLDTWPGKHFYGYSSLPVQPSKIKTTSKTEGLISQYFGRIPFTSNLYFLHPPLSIGDTDWGMPFRAFGAFGGENWSVQVGRDRLSWGPGVTGNLMLGEHLKYHEMARVTTYANNFKYTLVTSFFPHPKEFYPIIDDTTGNFTNKGHNPYDGLYMFLAHRLEWRMFRDTVGFALSEAIMYQSENNTLSIAVLNPSAIYHNYYINQNANSLLTFDLDYTPIKGLNLYGQFALDEFAIPGIESAPGVVDGARPSAFGALGGAKGVIALKRGVLTGSLEGAYTNPYLYLREGRKSAYDSDTQTWDRTKWPIDFVVAIRELDKSGEALLDETFIGYQYGPDAIVLNARVGYEEIGKWNVEGNFFYMWHGTHDKWTMYSGVAAGSGSNYPPYASTPTDEHTQGNYGDLNADKRNAVSRTLALGVRGGYSILHNLDVYGQVDYIHVANPGNKRENAPIQDMQVTVGIRYVL